MTIGRKFAFASSNKRKRVKNWEKQRGKLSAVDVNIVTDCQEQFGTIIKKEQRAAGKIYFMYVERKKID